MNKMKHLLLTILFACATLFVNAQDTFEVIGVFDWNESTKIFVEDTSAYDLGNTRSLTISDDKTKMTIKITDYKRNKVKAFTYDIVDFLKSTIEGGDTVNIVVVRRGEIPIRIEFLHNWTEAVLYTNYIGVENGGMKGYTYAEILVNAAAKLKD